MGHGRQLADTLRFVGVVVFRCDDHNPAVTLFRAAGAFRDGRMDRVAARVAAPMGCFGAGSGLYADDDISNGLAPFFVIAERRVECDRHRPIDVDFFRRRVAVAPIAALVIEGRDVGPEGLFFPLASGRINLCSTV